MNRFANTDITSSDGRKNKEAVPEEIYAYGFRPPVQTTEGGWTYGDELTANWLNFLMNDLYKGAVTLNRSKEVSPTDQTDYYAIQIGDILIQGGNFRALGTTAPQLMTFPIPFQAGGAPIVFGTRTQSQASATAFVASMDPTSPNTPATAIMWTTTGNGAAVAFSPVIWMAIGHVAANVGGVPQGLRDLRSHFSFSEQFMTYADGQENTGQPGTITVSQGFAPPVNNGGVWSQGDGLSAEAVNFLLRDLYRMPKYSGIPGDHNRNGVLEFGGFLMQWTIVDNPSAASAVWTFPVPFLNGDPHVVCFDVQGYAAAPSATEQTFAAITSTYSATQVEAFLTGGPVTSGNAIVKPASSFFILAVGLSSRQAQVPAANMPVLPGFANTPLTYPDGQLNKVAPSTAQIDSGFNFETATATGDFLTANKLNWLLNDLYKELKFSVVRAAFKPAGYVTAFPQVTFRLGNMMVQAGRVQVGDLLGTGGKIIFRDTFGGVPTLHITQRYGGGAPALGATSTARFVSVHDFTATDATVHPRNAAGAVVGDASANNYTFEWVAIGPAPL